MNYIIVQAGGKGTRLGHLTKNKPKALTPVENLPMILHLFRKYPDKRFVIIADYKKEVLHQYLEAFAEVKYQIVDAQGTGTCAGVRQALERIPEKEAFMLVWSDLILPEDFLLPEGYREVPEEEREQQSGIPKQDYVGISATFPCRWKYEQGSFTEERSTEHGVAGFFLFREKKLLQELPDSGELVRWFKEREREFSFKEWSLAGTREFGLLEEYEKLAQSKTRPFNRIIVEDEVLTKEPLDAQGEALAKRECAWYAVAKSKGIEGIPKIYGVDPLKMEYIRGKNIYEYDFAYTQKRKILEALTDTLKRLHAAGEIAADSFSMKETYFNKTWWRLSKIRDMVPFADEKFIRVNNRRCRNVYYFKDRLEKALDTLKCDRFRFIHGDCTFSNMMIRGNGQPVLIDPRGYFGFTELYGDERYDWAKLYYSIVGNYDRFNLKDFCMEIGGENGSRDTKLPEGEVEVKIGSNGWESLENDFFELTGADKDEIKLLHAVIWLSLTTYAWQDYDSVCGAFYNGLYYLEEVL